jgi:hypothetical protein
MDYTCSIKVLLVGNYGVHDVKYPWMTENLTVSDNDEPTGNAIAVVSIVLLTRFPIRKTMMAEFILVGLVIIRIYSQKMDSRSLVLSIFIMQHVNIVLEAFGLIKKLVIIHSSFMVPNNHCSRL